MECHLVKGEHKGLYLNGNNDILHKEGEERVRNNGVGQDTVAEMKAYEQQNENEKTLNQGGVQKNTNLSMLPVLWKDIEQAMILEPANETKTTFQISNKLNQIVVILVEENYCGKTSQDSCLHLCLKLDIFNKVYEWMTKNKLIMKEMATELLTVYSKLLTLCSDEIFRCEGILEPILVLMLALRPDEKQRLPLPLEKSYLKLLNNLSLRLVDQNILETFALDRVSKQGYKLPKYSFLSLILHYIHRDGEVGALARDSLLVCMQLTPCNEKFTNFIIEESSCCAILAAGLTGFYSLLPTTLSIAAEDWFCLTKETCDTIPELASFLRGLLFLCDVAKLSHERVYTRILDLVHDGFFLSVVGPALVQPSLEGKTAAVAFLDLMLREVTEPVMIRQFLKFILLGYCDGKPLLSSLISYILHDSQQLCMATLQLFKTLADLNCEDVIYHLILRYLIPCNHILPNQKRIIKELDFYCKSATMFLYLIPNCCLENSKLCKSRIQNGFLPDGVEKDDEKPPVDYPTAAQLRYPLSLESFMNYLHIAKFNLFACKRACRCWSAVYDGMDVMTELPRRRLSSKSGRGSITSEDRLRNLSNQFDRSRSSSLITGPRSRTSTSESREFKQPTDCLGPFLNALFDRIELMMENSFYVNLSLTELVSRIACYPQPLLRSFLLNSNLVLQPGVRSLFQILTTIANKTDMFVSQMEDHQRLLFTARLNLFKRQEHLNANVITESDKDESKNESSSESSVETLPSGGVEFHSSGKNRLNRFNSVVSQNTLPLKKENEPPKRSSSVVSPSGPGSSIIGLLHPVIRHAPRSPTRKPKTEGSPLKIDMLQKRKNQLIMRNAVYCALTLEEWLQELAAISLEHNLL